MTREEVEEIMGTEPKIQASFEVIGDDVKFIKLIVNGKEKVINIEELITTYTEPCRESDDYENEIADLYNRLDIAEYDKERLREEVTELEEKLKALSAEPCEDCISRAELLKAVDTWDKFGCDADTKLVPVKDCYVPYIHYDDVVKAIKGMPSIQPKTEILDKIKAEIQEYADNKAESTEMRAYYHCLQIIDKYKAESEVSNETYS